MVVLESLDTRMALIGFETLLIAVIVVSCANQPADGHKGVNSIPAKTIEEVLQTHTGTLISIPGVVGTAQGLCNGKPCILVFVAKKSPDLEQKIPHSIAGYPVVIQETGEFRAPPEKRK